jgi:hypothetical protein
MSHTTLEPEIREMQEKLQRMSAENYADRLVEIIHRTGWTETQVHLVRVVLDSVVHHLDGIERAQRALIEAAEEIGSAKTT